MLLRRRLRPLRGEFLDPRHGFHQIGHGVGVAEADVAIAVLAEASSVEPGDTGFIQQIIRANSPRGICGTLLALASRTDTTSSLSSITIPTCIIVGEHDKLTPPSDAQTMHTMIAGSELHILPHAAHMSNLENTQEFNERLMLFLRNVNGR